MRWLSPPAVPTLSKGDVHLWLTRFSDLGRVGPPAGATLAPDEEARARRLAFPDLRRRFVLGRYFLRAVLGWYLGMPARQVALACNAYGKPHLLGDDHNWLRFNLAHSGDLMVLAVTQHREVGVDVERRRPIEHADYVARTYFTSGERRALAAVCLPAHWDAFFALWTSKEAYGKARGTGLASPFEGFDSVMCEDSRELLPQSWHHHGASGTYHLRRFIPDHDYWGALALQTYADADVLDREIVGYRFRGLRDHPYQAIGTRLIR